MERQRRLGVQHSAHDVEIRMPLDIKEAISHTILYILMYIITFYFNVDETLLIIFRISRNIHITIGFNNRIIKHYDVYE